MRDPIRVMVKQDDLTLEGIKQFYIHDGKEDFKFNTLQDLFNSP